MNLGLHVFEILDRDNLSAVIITKAREWIDTMSTRSPADIKNQLERLSRVVGPISTREVARMVEHATSLRSDPIAPKPILSPATRTLLRHIGGQEVELSTLAWALLGVDVYVRAWNRKHFQTDCS